MNDNFKLYKKLTIIFGVCTLLSLILLCISPFISMLLEYFFNFKIDEILFLPILFLFFIFLVLLIIFGSNFYNCWIDINNKKIILEKYKSFSFSNLEYISEPTHNNKYNTKCIKFPTSVNKQEEIENTIKNNDPNFNKLYFKQKAIVRFNYLQKSFINKDFKYLKRIESKVLLDSQLNNTDLVEGISNYKIIYSFIDNYQTNENEELLDFYITLKKDNNEVLSYVMTFSRKKGTTTNIQSDNKVNNCPKCGGIISDDLFTCKYCGETLSDDFNWLIVNCQIYSEELNLNV